MYGMEYIKPIGVLTVKLYQSSNKVNAETKDVYDLNKRDNLVGHVDIVFLKDKPVFDDNGDIVNKSDIVKTMDIKNTIVYTGRAIIASLMDSSNLNPHVDPIKFFAMGNGATAGVPASETDTDLLNQTHIQAFDDITAAGTITRIFSAVVPAGTATGTFNEIALKTNDGVLFSRRVFPPIVKDPDIFLLFKWAITF